MRSEKPGAERHVCCAGNNFCGSVPSSLSVWDCTSVCMNPVWQNCSANGTAPPLPPMPKLPTIDQATCESFPHVSLQPRSSLPAEPESCLLPPLRTLRLTLA